MLGVWNTQAGNVPDGTYQLRLNVFLPNGNVQTAIVTNILVQNREPATVRQPLPSAEFTMDVESGYAPVSVRFTGPSDASISYHSWNFGDGNTSSEKDPIHTFRAAGDYSVSLTVGGPSGSSSFARRITVKQKTGANRPL